MKNDFFIGTVTRTEGDCDNISAFLSGSIDNDYSISISSWYPLDIYMEEKQLFSSELDVQKINLTHLVSAIYNAERYYLVDLIENALNINLLQEIPIFRVSYIVDRLVSYGIKTGMDFIALLKPWQLVCSKNNVYLVIPNTVGFLPNMPLDRYNTFSILSAITRKDYRKNDMPFFWKNKIAEIIINDSLVNYTKDIEKRIWQIKNHLDSLEDVNPFDTYTFGLDYSYALENFSFNS